MPEETKSLETRFGLVMYGGVSLAIYINGVAQEFFNAVRGRGVYKLIKALTDSDIVVDIISGTSAGGINGIMLAYALCNEKEFTSSANLWRNDGDIRRLLRPPNGKAETGWSLLNSEGYYQPQLESAYREMEEINPEVKAAESPSKFQELDLFVTGTDVDGRRFTQFDDAGHPIDVKDHRAVFLLKHREGRKEPFKPGGKGNTPPGCGAPDPEDTFRALAKLSRLTSCFPAAFSPVTVTRPGQGGDGADSLLQWWGGLGRESVFLDGGLIDNKPFTYTLREIFYRSAERRVDRKLFYVEPDPEHWEEIASATQPNFAQAITASLIGIPGYESISDDLRLLASHNSKLDRYRRMVAFLDTQSDVEPPSEQAEKLYERSRLIALSERCVRGILRTQGRDELLDRETRAAAAGLVESFEQSVSGSLEASIGPPSPPSPEQAERMRRLIEAFWPRLALAQSDADPERRFGATASLVAEFVAQHQKAEAELRPKSVGKAILEDYDAEFRLRRLFRTIYFLGARLGDKAGLEAPGPFAFHGQDEAGNPTVKEVARAGQYRKVWGLLNKQVELLDIIRTATEKVIDDSTFDWKNRSPDELWRAADAVLQNFLDAQTAAAQLLPKAFTCSPLADRPEWLPAETQKEFNTALRAHGKRVAEATAKVLPDFYYEKDSEGRENLCFRGSFRSFLRVIDECEGEMIRRLLPDEADPVRQAYEGFEAVDAKLYPVELIAELNEKDIIKTFRISPFDARRGFSNKGLSDKVSGDALYHFGGFFKRSWRSNDILWGRLDCLCQLVETLLTPHTPHTSQTPHRLAEVVSDARLLETVVGRFYEDDPGDPSRYRPRAELSPKALFPYAGKLTWEKCEEWLLNLLLCGDLSKQPDPAREADRQERRRQALRPETLDEVVELLVEAAQLEVIKDDVPKVITDALEEQVGWNQFRIPKDAKPGNGLQGAAQAGAVQQAAADAVAADDPFVFKPPPADLDSFVGVFAAENRTRQWVEAMRPNDEDGEKRPTETRLGRFFKDRYRVGTEALLKDIPPLVLLEILSVSLLVLRNCVLDVFGEGADRVKNHPLYVAAVDWPLRAFYLLVRFLRRAPRWEKEAVGVLGVLALITLGLTLYRWDAMVMPKGEFDAFSFGVFLVLPALVLYAIYFYIRRDSYLLGKVKKGRSAGAQKAFKVLPVLVRAGLAAFPLVTILFVMWQLYAKAGRVDAAHLDAQKVYIDPGSFYPGLLIAACALALAGPFFAHAFRVKLFDFFDALLNGRFKTGRRAEALRAALENYFSVEEMREIGRGTLSSTPFEWDKVRKHLEKKKAREAERLSKALGAAATDDDRTARRNELNALASAWRGRLEKLDQKFGSYKIIKWGNLRAFMERQGAQDGLSDQERQWWGETLTLLTRKLEVPREPNPQEWPYVEEAQPGAPRPALWRRMMQRGSIQQTPRTEAERRQQLAAKLVYWARKTDKKCNSLARLAERMRFINPEALYGE